MKLYNITTDTMPKGAVTITIKGFDQFIKAQSAGK